MLMISRGKNSARRKASWVLPEAVGPIKNTGGKMLEVMNRKVGGKRITYYRVSSGDGTVIVCAVVCARLADTDSHSNEIML